MRIRLKSVPPLPTLKYWYEVPKYLLENEDSTVKDLKKSCIQSFFTGKGVKDTNIVIELDEFELEDNSLLSIVRDNDLLMCVSVLLAIG